MKQIIIDLRNKLKTTVISCFITLFCIVSCREKREEVNILDYPKITNILYNLDEKNIDFKLFKINDTLFIKEGYYNNKLVILDSIKNKEKHFYIDGWIKRFPQNTSNTVFYEILRVNNQSNLNQEIAYNNCEIDYSKSFFYKLDKETNLVKLFIYNKYIKNTEYNYLFLILADSLKNDYSNINHNLKLDTIGIDTIIYNGKENDIINFKLKKEDLNKNGYFVFLGYDKNDKLISNQRLYYKNKSANAKFECR